MYYHTSLGQWSIGSKNEIQNDNTSRVSSKEIDWTNVNLICFFKKKMKFLEKKNRSIYGY